MKTFDSDFMNYHLPADTKDRRIRLYELSATSRRVEPIWLSCFEAVSFFDFYK